MRAAQFDLIVARRLKLIQEILLKKRAEYASGGKDRLHNFARAAEMLRCTKEKAIIGMWTKHVVSILDIVDDLDKAVPSETMIDEKIGDAISYLILLEAALKERHLRIEQ